MCAPFYNQETYQDNININLKSCQPHNIFTDILVTFFEKVIARNS